MCVQFLTGGILFKPAGQADAGSQPATTAAASATAHADAGDGRWQAWWWGADATDDAWQTRLTPWPGRARNSQKDSGGGAEAEQPASRTASASDGTDQQPDAAKQHGQQRQHEKNNIIVSDIINMRAINLRCNNDTISDNTSNCNIPNGTVGAQQHEQGLPLVCTHPMR